MLGTGRELLLLAGAGAALSAATTYYELGVYLPSLNSPHTLLEDVAHRPSELSPGPGLSRRLSVVLVDGLSFDAARSTEALAPLRRAGVFRSIAVSLPSFTSPALVSMVTGLSPRDSGTRKNGDLDGVVGLDSVLTAMGDRGIPIRLFGRGFSDQATILAPPVSAVFRAGLFAPGVEIGERGLSDSALPNFDGKSPARAFDWFHWGEVDEVGHRYGGASARYREEADNAAGFVAHYAATLDLDQDVLVVLSDHGHTPQGGHGGDEPEVTHAFFLGVGGIFRRGVELGERPMRDIASTLAVLAGVRTPSSNLGLPMLDAFSIGEPETAYLLAEPFDESLRFLCTLRYSPRCAELDAMVSALRKPDPDAVEPALALHASLMAEREADLAARPPIAEARRAALASLLVAGTLGAALAWLRKQRPTRLAEVGRALAPTLALVAGYAAFLYARGYRPSFSRLMPIPIYARDATEAGLAGAGVALLVAGVLRVRAEGAWTLLLAISAAFFVLAATVGADSRFVPPNVAGVLVFLTGPLVPTAAVTAVVIALVAWSRGVARRRA